MPVIEQLHGVGFDVTRPADGLVMLQLQDPDSKKIWQIPMPEDAAEQMAAKLSNKSSGKLVVPEVVPPRNIIEKP